MQNVPEILTQVYAAKTDKKCADNFIRAYIPFIKKEASRFLSRICAESDDEYSVALMAFYEAIRNYDEAKGAFLSYAALTINSRLIDFSRKETRHKGHISMDEEKDEERSLKDTLADSKDYHTENENLAATKAEIAELVKVMSDFGLSLTDISENCPKQQRTLESCRKVVAYAIQNRDVLEEMLRSKKLPISRLSVAADVEKKTLERHRKYIMAMLIIQTNGYEIIRGHIRRVLNVKGGVEA